MGLDSKFFFKKCPYFGKEGRWENEIKNVPNLDVPFYGRRVGVYEKGTKSCFLFFFYFEVVPKVVTLQIEPRTELEWKQHPIY